MPIMHDGIPFPALSRYEIAVTSDSVIGRGGMGAVFKARDRLLDRDVAIKTIHPINLDLSLLQQDRRKRTFLREAMTHARLGRRYPDHIVEVRNYGIEDDTPFMEMEILSGGSLRDIMNQASKEKRRGPLFDEETIKKILLQICAGLKILHHHDVYHSDLKPENILFIDSSSFDLRIADLGMARITKSDVLSRAGIQTIRGGSMHYTQQSVHEGAQKATERTDLYSVGVILFELITRETLLWGQAKQTFVEGRSDLTRSAKDLIVRLCQLMGRNNCKDADELEGRIQKTNFL